MTSKTCEERSQQHQGGPTSRCLNLLSRRPGLLPQGVQRAGGGDSATTLFFFTVNDNSDLLDCAKEQDVVGYCVFGLVVSGMDVPDKIKRVQSGSRNDQADVPIQDVRTVTIRRE